ncbi:hypothetical protein PAMC26510_13330 [Caballeronia sordidicola]|uniref:Uncharacterized protein n=1 Tax=Caballeronia sordidicola TaxID=196367 RepID=A0A242MX04_CABSO|nr:pyrimidine/purine nucleoside phosphorylase [Caballeronia sordidicola]OTP75416.1 hypothetical protein PAMC26510_13330 [Caballeronia sordidicola]
MASDTTNTQFDNASIIKRANIYFDGKCVSHTVLLGDGTRKTLGVCAAERYVIQMDGVNVVE